MKFDVYAHEYTKAKFDGDTRIDGINNDGEIVAEELKSIEEVENAVKSFFAENPRITHESGTVSFWKCEVVGYENEEEYIESGIADFEAEYSNLED